MKLIKNQAAILLKQQSKTASWIHMNCRFAKPIKADVLPNSDIDLSNISNEELKERSISPLSLSGISDEISEDVAKQISTQYNDLKFLAHGCYGVVYENKNRPGWLVKITTDIFEISTLEKLNSISQELKRYIVPNQNFREYEVLMTPSSGSKRTIGVIETKRIPTPSSYEQKWIDSIRTCLSLHDENNITNNYNTDTFKADLLGNFGQDMVNEFDDEANSIFNKYMKLMQTIVNNNFIDRDMSGTNIGKMDDKYVIIDIGAIL